MKVNNWRFVFDKVRVVVGGFLYYVTFPCFCANLTSNTMFSVQFPSSVLLLGHATCALFNHALAKRKWNVFFLVRKSQRSKGIEGFKYCSFFVLTSCCVLWLPISRRNSSHINLLNRQLSPSIFFIIFFLLSQIITSQVLLSYSLYAVGILANVLGQPEET